VRLATLLQHVAACWYLKIELVRMPGRNIVARSWPNDYNIRHEKFDYLQIGASNSEHFATCLNRVTKRAQLAVTNKVAMCSFEMMRSVNRGLRFDEKTEKNTRSEK